MAAGPPVRAPAATAKGCYKCGKEGHWSRDCMVPQSEWIKQPMQEAAGPGHAGGTADATAADAAPVPPIKRGRKRPKLTIDDLKKENGLPEVFSTFPDIFRKGYCGKGHEASDLERLLSMYARWQQRIFDHGSFDVFLETLEKIGSTHQLKVELRELRQGILHDLEKADKEEAPAGWMGMGETAGDSAEAPGHGADAFEDWSDDEAPPQQRSAEEQARFDEEEAAIEAAEQQMEAARLAREQARGAGQPSGGTAEEQAWLDEEEAAIEAAEQQMEATRLAREPAANAGQPAMRPVEEQARLDEEEDAIEAAEQQMEATRLARELASNAGQPAERPAEEQARLDEEEDAIEAAEQQIKAAMLDTQHASGIILVQAGPEEQVRPDEQEEVIETAQTRMEARLLAGEQAANTANEAEGQPEIDEEEAAIEAAERQVEAARLSREQAKAQTDCAPAGNYADCPLNGSMWEDATRPGNTEAQPAAMGHSSPDMSTLIA